MASSKIKLPPTRKLAPNESRTWGWNNATPSGAVWYIQAVPLESSFTSAQPIEQSVEVEVTRVWRKLNRTEGGEIDVYKYEHEIWYVIKNVGSRVVEFDVYASIIS